LLRCILLRSFFAAQLNLTRENGGSGAG